MQDSSYLNIPTQFCKGDLIYHLGKKRKLNLQIYDGEKWLFIDSYKARDLLKELMPELDPEEFIRNYRSTEL